MIEGLIVGGIAGICYFGRNLQLYVEKMDGLISGRLTATDHDVLDWLIYPGPCLADRKYVREQELKNL